MKRKLLFRIESRAVLECLSLLSKLARSPLGYLALNGWTKQNKGLTMRFGYKYNEM
jgi:hypothetical protein